MRMVGVDAGGSVVWDRPLAHGEHPEAAAYADGMLLVEPLDATRDPGGELVVRWRTGPIGEQPAPDVLPPGVDPGLDLVALDVAGVVPQLRQRIAAYAVVLSDRGLLATEFSARTAAAGRWGLPGGGIEDGEQPSDAALREVVEETDQRLILGDLVTVQSSHWIGRSPRGIIQDFQAIRLVYRADCPEPTTPRVLDVGGTTSSARWVSLAGWQRLAWTTGWRSLLTELLAGEDRPPK